MSDRDKEMTEFQEENSELYEFLNKNAKESLLSDLNIDQFSKFVTHYCFRNGPVEDMHADGKLGQEDMKILNKYMVNRVAGILSLAMNDEWCKLQLLYAYYATFYGRDWDDAEPDIEEANMIFYEDVLPKLMKK